MAQIGMLAILVILSIALLFGAPFLPRWAGLLWLGLGVGEGILARTLLGGSPVVTALLWGHVALQVVIGTLLLWQGRRRASLYALCALAGLWLLFSLLPPYGGDTATRLYSVAMLVGAIVWLVISRERFPA